MPERNKALFLDRDGVINIDTHYAHKLEEIVFIDGIFPLCQAAHNKDYLLIVITNQAGIGRGYYTEAEYQLLTNWLKEQFVRHDAPLAAVYFCPHHPLHGVGEYKKDCTSRKPNPGMILRAQREHDIDLSASLLIGDKESDMQAGARAGIGTLLHYAVPPSPYRTIGALSEAMQYL